jgi:HYR domain
MTRRTRSRRSALGAALGLALTLVAAALAAPAASQPLVAAGKLGFRVTLRQSGPFTLPCPGGVPDLSAPPTTACVQYTGAGSVRGLGKVSMGYADLIGVGPPACPADHSKQLTTTGRLGVAGKGEIYFTFTEGARCVPDASPGAWLGVLREFTITGGTGRFASASGRGTSERIPATWTGTLEVAGLAFDLTAPRLRGAVSKTVRAQNGAQSARVTFNVTATDGVDGVVPVSCEPRSGSRFEVGPTRVRCRAIDSSANAVKAAFTVTVTRGR